MVLVPNWAPNKPLADSKKNAILLSNSNGYLFTNDEPEKRLYSALCRRDAFVFDAVNTVLDLKQSINAIDSQGNSLIGFKFLTNVSALDNTIEHVSKPTQDTYHAIFEQNPLDHGKFFHGKAFTFSNPFVLSFCNELTASQTDQIKQSVKATWFKVKSEYEICNCFEIFIIQSERYIGANNQLNTQLTYLAKFNDVIIEQASV